MSREFQVTWTVLRKNVVPEITNLDIRHSFTTIAVFLTESSARLAYSGPLNLSFKIHYFLADIQAYEHNLFTTKCNTDLWFHLCIYVLVLPLFSHVWNKHQWLTSSRSVTTVFALRAFWIHFLFLSILSF